MGPAHLLPGRRLPENPTPATKNLSVGTPGSRRIRRSGFWSSDSGISRSARRSIIKYRIGTQILEENAKGGNQSANT